jgi:hypothetical protein
MRRPARNLPRILCAAIALLASAASAQDGVPTLKSGVPILVREVHGVPRIAEPVTFGMPIPESAKLKDVKSLYVRSPNDEIVPSQIRVLQRWRAAPDAKKAPIRWILVDFQADVEAHGVATYRLQLAKKGKKPKGVKLAKPRFDVALSASRLAVETGVARFIVSRERAGFLESVEFDLDGDGALEPNERLIDSSTGEGFVLTDRFGARYTSAAHPMTLEIVESGKLRTVVKVTGRHAPEIPGGGLGRDFLQYTTYYSFFAGKPYVRVQHSLENDYLDAPLGAIGFESYDLVLPMQPTSGSPLGGRLGLAEGLDYSETGSLTLYQDSDGGSNWAAAPNTSFQGFQVRKDGAQVVADGAQAPGWIDVAAADRGLLFAAADFFENFPKALSFDGSSLLRFGIFPAEHASFHWLDDAQRKTTEFLVQPHGADAFDADRASQQYFRPLRPFCDPTWMRASKAWGDAGDLDDPPQSDEVLLAFDAGKLTEMYNQAFQSSTYQFGWQHFGEYIWAKNTHTTGSPRNRLSYFDRFAINGSEAAFRVFELFAKHSRDIRTYHLDGFDVDEHPNAILWEGVPWSKSPDKLGRDAIPTAYAPHKQGIPSTGHGWNGFDIEHMVVDDLYEHYLLTGDHVTLSALQRIGQAMRTWPIYVLDDPVGSTRGIGWALRALIKCWQVTGDERVLDCANVLVDVVRTTYNQSPSPITGEVYHWLTRQPASGSHVKTTSWDAPWQLAVAIHGLLLHHRETGDAQSRKIALDVADYLVDHCWNGVTMHESVANDDPSIVNPKSDNTGINTWIPSALALCYREDPRVAYLGVAQSMYNSVPILQAWNTYYGWGVYHWWHNYRSLILGH